MIGGNKYFTQINALQALTYDYWSTSRKIFSIVIQGTFITLQQGDIFDSCQKMENISSAPEEDFSINRIPIRFALSKCNETLRR